MTEHKNFLRNVFDAMVEARTRQAERELAHYSDMFDVKNPSTKL